MALRFINAGGQWQNVRQDAPLPTAGGQVLHWLSDDFNASAVNPELWDVTGSPTVSNSVLTVGAGQALLSKMSFQPPCLVEAVVTMTARAGTDDFRVGLYQDDDNLVEWRAAGTATANMDAVMRAGGVADDQNSIGVDAVNNTYRLASIYVGLNEVVWLYRHINLLSARGEVRRIRELGIPDGPFRVRLAGLAGTSSLRVHRVTAYQLADIMPPGGLGHILESLSIPVRLTNTPFVASPSSQSLGVITSVTDTFSSLAAGSVATGSTRTFATEHTYIQVHFSGDQPFTAWFEAQVDGSNWQVVWYGTAVDATADGVVRYYASTPLLRLVGSRSMRTKVRNGGAAAGNFRSVIIGGVM